MALINCSECGRQISDKARACPGCGAPPCSITHALPPAIPAKRKTGCITLIVASFFGLLVFFALVSQCSRNSTSSSSASDSQKSQTSPQPTIDKNPEKQKEREKLITDLQQRGVFGKIECRDSGATAVAGNAFYSLDFDTKQSFVGVVYAYCFNGAQSYVSISIKDIRTNKKIGTFTKEFGLKFE